MTIERFIIIDDDPINNSLCKYLIKKVAWQEAEIISFISAEKALDYIRNAYSSEKPCSTILLLDINMPDVDGWEFLAMYEPLPNHIRQQIEIYLLSSSLDNRDMERAQKNKFILNFIVKPLTVDAIKAMINKTIDTNLLTPIL